MTDFLVFSKVSGVFTSLSSQKRIVPFSHVPHNIFSQPGNVSTFFQLLLRVTPQGGQKIIVVGLQLWRQDDSDSRARSMRDLLPFGLACMCKRRNNLM